MKKLNINQNLIIAVKALVLTMISIVVLELVLALMRRIGFAILTDSLAGNVLLEITILFASCLTVRKYSKGDFFSSIGFKHQKGNVKYVFRGICIGLIVAVLTYFTVFSARIAIYEGIGFNFYSLKVVLFFIISLFVRCFFAGVCEEVFFRGILLNYLAKYKGKKFGLLVSSLIFAVLHCTRYSEISQLSAVLISGIVLGSIYIITKSLYTSIGLHFALDFFLSIVGPKGEPSLFVFNINPKFSLAYMTQSIFIISLFIELLLLFILFLINRNRTNEALKKQYSMK